MGTAERRSKQKEQVRTSILTTAWRLVEEDGWESLSIRKIADAIGYSAPVIYDHFHNKEAILAEFATTGFRLLSKKIRLAKKKSGDPAEQIRAIANAYWHFAFKNKRYFQLMYGLGMPGCEMEKCFPGIADVRNAVMEPITAIIAKSSNPAANPCLKYYTFWSILYGLISIKNMKNDRVKEDVTKMVLDDAIAGFIKNLD